VTPRLGVILVNYGRADDTIECLESVLRSTIPLRVAVVDNSSDGSLDRIAEWARGERPAPEPAQLAALTTPPMPKPVDHDRLTAAEARARPPGAARLTLIDAGGNLGFAGGNNIGLAHLAQDPDIEAFWLLNNDTVIAPDAAASVLAAFEAGIGMLGTQVRFYHRPGVVQALNGHRFDRWTGTSRGIGAETSSAASFDPAAVRHDTDFVLGASLAVSRAFLDAVGPMAEDYFLYFEEVDWAWRNAGRFGIGFAAGAVVWHKEGGSIGSSSRPGARGSFSDYYLMRSKLRFVARHLPHLLPVHWAVALGQIGRRVARGQPAKARVMLRALIGLKY
jgi:GT2 family glycosyltransferase